MEDLGDDGVPLHRGVGPRQHRWGDPIGESPGAPHLHPVVEDRQRHRPTGNGVVPVDEGVDQDLAHGVGRQQGAVDALEPPRLDATREREVPLAEQLGLLQELEGRGANVALVQELCLVGAAEASQPQLALGIVGEEPPAEEHHRRPEDLPPPPDTQPVQQIRQAAPHWPNETARGPGGLDDPQHLVAVDVLERDLLGHLVLPAAAAVGPVGEERLVPLLTHAPGGVLHPLVRPAVKGERHGVALAVDAQDQHGLAAPEVHALDLEEERRLELLAGVGDLEEGLLADLLAHDLAARADADQHPSPGAVGKSAEGLERLAQLAGGSLELQGGVLAAGDEGGEGGSHGSYRSLPRSRSVAGAP